jgi:adenylate kinase
MIEKPLTVLFYGPSGSGKGTQAKLLKEYLEKNNSSRETEYIETGALLRIFIKEEGYTQKLTSEAMATGGLLPSFLPIYLWTKLFIEQLDGGEHVILDGLARREREVSILEGALRFYGRSNYQIISIELSEESARARLIGRGRSDDMDDAAIKRRLSWYKDEVIPAIKKFEEVGGKVHRLDGEPSIEEIHQVVLKTLGLV